VKCDVLNLVLNKEKLYISLVWSVTVD